MRITNRMMSEHAIQSMNQNLEALSTLQERVTSGKQYQRVSDNPSLASQAISIRSTIQTNQGYLSAAQDTDAWMGASESALGQMNDLVIKAMTLVNRGLNDTTDAETRKNAIAPEVDLLLQQAIDLANTTHQGNYIFAGFQVNTKPFQLTTDAQGKDSIPCSGHSGEMVRSLSPGQSMLVNVLGDSAFDEIFKGLIAARDALLTNDRDALSHQLGNLDAGMDILGKYHTQNGARQRQVQTLTENYEQIQLGLQSLLSSKENVNAAEAISLLRNQEITYQAVIAVAQRAISTMSLFDILN
ncbi:MAG: flagellar hook-associated protein FlgL [Anaerolineaceae bacterium]|nr:flagellar hook-associated protein FlgL [Anaerolineaceae bacterium]